MDRASQLVWLSFNSRVFAWFQINGKDMKIARHEDAVAMLTGGLSYVTLVVVREKVINKRMLPLSKLQDQSLLNKRLGTKVGNGSKVQSNLHLIGQILASYEDVLWLVTSRTPPHVTHSSDPRDVNYVRSSLACEH